jgi:DNA-binding LacI/PurR family transcriptional regulator
LTEAPCHAQGSRRPRISDVAARAGVSSATVSRALNGADSVALDLRERVLQAAADLDYRPNRLARNLRRQETQMIGVVVSDIENPHFSETVRAIEDACYGAGYGVLLCNSDERAEKQARYLQALVAERVVAVILATSSPEAPEVAEVLDAGIPLVAIDRPVVDARADAVLADNTAAAETATRWLVDAGHRSIGFVGGPGTISTGSERRRGHERAVGEAGVMPIIAEADFRIDGGQAATERMLDGTPTPTALVVANNLMTIGALRALAARRLRVPDDVALVAIDDPFWAELVDPPLTTLAQPVRAMAETAVTLVLERIRGRSQAKRVVFEFALRVRGSCGRPHGASDEQPPRTPRGPRPHGGVQ